MENLNWKERNKVYLKEIQKFLDKADNISDENLKQDLIYQMLRCDSVLTKLAQEEIEKKNKN